MGHFVGDTSIKYLTADELVEVEAPHQVFGSLEANIGPDQEWFSQFQSINDLRSLMKFNEELFKESTYLISVFKRVDFLDSRSVSSCRVLDRRSSRMP